MVCQSTGRVVMDTLFTAMEDERKQQVAPLAVRMRPRTLEDVVGQQDAVGPGSWLRAAIEQDNVSSVILYGPAGTGKTSIAHVIAESTKATFVEVSAIGGTVSDLRREIDAAEKRLALNGSRTILFVDEIHRFNRSQQDALLHAVENRIVVLVGATTENPFFEVNSALISRSRVVGLKGLSDGDVAQLVDRAVADPRGLDGLYTLDPAARSAIVLLAGGDGRASLTTLELAAGMQQPGTRENPAVITKAQVESATPHRALPYDKNKDMHYDIISAFIKSMRGSDPDAALYWLARMIDGGRGPQIYRAPYAHPRVRGRGQRRSSGIAGGRGRVQISGGHRVSRMPHQLGAGGNLYRSCAEKQRVRGGYRCCLGGSAKRAQARCPRLSSRQAPPRLRALRRVQIPARLSCRLGRSTLLAGRA